MPEPTVRYAGIRRVLGKPARAAERIVGGGRARERVLLALLGAHYASRFRREWRWSAEPPHFFDHRMGAFDFAFRPPAAGVYPWLRGFYVAEVVRENDVLLDIGCGDGFFTSRFYATRCRTVDALDIEPAAVATARRKNYADNIRYYVSDAIANPFPREQYDVIVLDGALGHVSAEAMRTLLTKAARALAPEGIFCGSESLGSSEGLDHLQFFPDLESLGRVLSGHFSHVSLRDVGYFVRGRIRREGFWRCAMQPTRIHESKWLSFGPQARAGCSRTVEASG